MNSKAMYEVAKAVDELLEARGPLYEMKKAEVRRKLKEMEREDHPEKVYICSQYGTRGDMATNLEMAKVYCMAVIEEGKIPICPHLFLSGVLNDQVKSQRAAGMRIGMWLLEECDELRVCSRLSEGMKKEILKAEEWGIPVMVQDMGIIYSEDQAGFYEKEIMEDLEVLLHGQEHNTEVH